MDIVVGNDLLDEVRSYLENHKFKKLFLITDETVGSLYLKKILYYLSEFHIKVYAIKPGEESKNIETVLNIYNELVSYGYNRESLIISFGGGVVGDIAGFIAATYMRGIKYIQIPTTLLAQVDSSIGGKVGIDFKGYKNMIGSFYFPEKTFTDISFLATLEKQEITSGLGEIMKYGLIKEYDFFEYVKENLNRIYKVESEILLKVVEKSIQIKSEIVKKDKKDTGIRRTLNFGHTIGHSIEALYGFKRLNHGESVILGMIYESYIAMEMGLIEHDYFQEIFSVLSKLVEPFKFTKEEIDILLKIMLHDKKNKDQNIVFVLPVGKGKSSIFERIDCSLIKESLKGDWK